MFNDESDNSSYRSGIPKKFYHLINQEIDEWQIPPWELLIYKDKCVGYGNFGTVFKACWRSTPVIAKVANSNLSEPQKNLLIREINNMTKLHHPNVIQLLGFVKDPFIIVMEYMANGDLWDYIKYNKLTIKQKIDICIEMLRAMTYIHSRKPHYIIHRDIKLQNILVNSYGKIKLADFGLSKIVVNPSDSFNVSLPHNNSTTELTTNVGTKRYMAPELFKHNNYDNLIDIWSCGIAFYEIFEETKFIVIDNNHFDINFIKTPYDIQNIILNHMLQQDSGMRSQAADIILHFQNLKIEPISSKKCLCFR